MAERIVMFRQYLPRQCDFKEVSQEKHIQTLGNWGGGVSAKV